MKSSAQDMINRLAENVAVMAEQQALIQELLAVKLTFSEEDRMVLVNTAQTNFKRAESLRQQAQALGRAWQ